MNFLFWYLLIEETRVRKHGEPCTTRRTAHGHATEIKFDNFSLLWTVFSSNTLLSFESKYKLSYLFPYVVQDIYYLEKEAEKYSEILTQVKNRR